MSAYPVRPLLLLVLSTRRLTRFLSKFSSIFVFLSLRCRLATVLSSPSVVAMYHPFCLLSLSEKTKMVSSRETKDESDVAKLR